MTRIDKPARDETLARGANGSVSGDDNDIDRILADSFPASDPPPWTLGVTAGHETSDSTRERPERPSGSRRTGEW